MKYIQSFLLSLGNYGCYVFCIIDIAQDYLKRKFDYNEIFGFIEKGIKNGFIAFNKDNYADKNNFYVLEPAQFLEMMINKKCLVRKERADYTLKQNEFLVERWVNKGYAHFARINKDFNSLQTSSCVNKGEVESTRVFTILEGY